MQSELPPLPELPGLNLSRAAKMLGGNQELLLRLIHKFPKNHGLTTTEISTALEKGDKELAHRLAHTLKGVSGTIGADKLYDCTEKIIKGLKSDNNIKDSLEEMETILQEVLSSIGQLQ